MQPAPNKDKISIIIHPVTRELLYDWEPGMTHLPINITGKILQWVTPFSIAKIEGIRSKVTNEEINGDLVLCPLLMEQFVSLNSKTSLRKVIQTVRTAEKNGAKLICLVAYTAMVGTKGIKIQEITNTPITNGLSLTSATLPLSIIKAAEALNHNRRLKVFIYGGNSLVTIMIKGLQSIADRFCVYYHKKDKLLSYYEKLPDILRKKTKIISHFSSDRLKEADIIVNVLHKFPAGFDDKILKKGAIVLDSSYPRTIHSARPDILIIDGITMIPPGTPRFNFNFGLPEGLCFPCMAESITLAFEKRYETYSLGKELYYNKTSSIYNMAKKHGFTFGPLTSFEKIIPDEKFADVIKHTKPKKKIFGFF